MELNEIHSKKKYGKTPNNWKLNYILLNNCGSKEKVIREI